MNRLRHNRGSALGMVIITGVVFAIAAFSVLTMSFSGASHPAGTPQSFQARYAAEAGLVWAYERLWLDPNYPASSCVTGPCTAACTDTIPIDTDGNGPLPATNVNITVTNCGPNNTHQVSARVTYTTS